MKGNRKELSVPQEMFVEYLIQGYSQRKAYIKAYPDSKDSRPSTIDIKAWKLFHLESVQKRYKEIRDSIAEETIRKAVWSKEEAISELKSILDANKKESGRYEQAYEDEMELLDRQIQEKEDSLINPKGYMSRKRREEIQNEIDELKMMRIKANRRHQSSKSVNDAILQAVLQLNTMMGFDKVEKKEDSLKVEAQVSFVDDVPDED